MKNFITGTLLGVLTIFLIVAFCFLYFFKLSNDARKRTSNIENCTRIHVGMQERDVVNIMGYPDETYNSYFNDASIIYTYKTPLLSSSNIEIYLDNNHNVVRVTFP